MNRSLRHSSLLLAVATCALVTVSCQQQTRDADASPPDANTATADQPAAVDTPPAQPAAPAPAAAPTETTAAAADSPPQQTAGDTAAGGEKPTQTAAGGDVLNGWKQYEANCSRCHGQDALGSAFAPDLRTSVGRLGHAGFVQVTKEGRPARGMPPFGAVLEDKQINDIIAYLEARASGKLGPGRPSG